MTSRPDAAEMQPFNILGPLPTGTTVLEASAGTGKTYAVGALVTRYVAEGEVTLDELLVITFGRAASQELRERVRAQLVTAERALADPALAREHREELIQHLATGTDEQVAERRSNLATAIATYDAATIATTHQFCQLVLRSLGVAGDSDAGAELVEDLADLVEEIVDDLYLRRFGQSADPPPFDRKAAIALAHAVVSDPHATPSPEVASADGVVRERLEFAADVLDELDRRKRRRGVLSYDDLLSRLADALAQDDSAASRRMQHRWRVVLVDEFQDTDPVQWQVLDRAFSGVATMVLIGDPKQAIYAFRGGDVSSYLAAAATAGTRMTLATNRRSDAGLVAALQEMTRGVALGDPRIVVHPVDATHEQRLVGAPSDAPVRMRQVRLASFASTYEDTVKVDLVRDWVAADLADDVARLLSSGAEFEGRPVRAGDVAVLMSSLKHVGLFREALAERGIASVITSGSNVMIGRAGDEWLALLEAMEQPSRAGRVRSLALTSFVGASPVDLDDADALTDEVGETVRTWLELFRSRGIAAVFEAAGDRGLAARVLAEPDGARLLTDLQHLAQVLHDVSRRDALGIAALLAWFRRERLGAQAGTERTRRLDTDAAAVQIATIHGSKGLQYPIVYLPLAFTAWIDDKAGTWRFHDDDGRRRLDIGGAATDEVRERATAEELGEELRKTYVALTRAQSQVVLWWASCWDSGAAGLTRLLLGRPPGNPLVPGRMPRGFDDDLVGARLQAWAEAGAFVLEESRPVAATAPEVADEGSGLEVRRFERGVDEAWRRTSYSGLIRVTENQHTQSEPESSLKDDEGVPEEDVGLRSPGAEPPADDVASPMADLPSGATFGSLVHAVLEHADVRAPDLRAELAEKVAEERRWWGVPTPTEELAEALLPMQETSLGSLADDLRLVDIGPMDRLCELDFELPLVGGDARRAVAEVKLSALAGLLRTHLGTHPMARYADQLDGTPLGEQSLRGYLSGSIDVVLRVPDGAGHRYLVVDYKTNLLGDRDRPLTAWDYRPTELDEAMLHSHYPLQALLYSVVVHRFLRGRLPDYDPGRHLGGILYLYVRGMCGPQTPRQDGEPCGVFSWRPPAALVLEISALLDGQVG